MLAPHPPGYHSNLTPSVIDRIIAAVPQVLVVNQIAGLAEVPKVTLHDWLKRGAKEANEGKDTIFAQLSNRFHVAKSKKLAEYIGKIEELPDNFRALTWLVEKGFREDFGAESEELRELRAMFEQLMIAKGLK